MKSKAFEIDPDTTSGPQHVLPPLEYGYSDLAACIDQDTMVLHHDKHHAGYVDKLNELLRPYPDLHRRSTRWLLLNTDSIPEKIRLDVQHNAGGHLNHSLFWEAMSPSGAPGPTGPLSVAIDAAYGSLSQFQSRFEEAGAALFGSGWVWLVAGSEPSVPELQIVTTSGHENPMEQGQYPLLVNDVWEHAYYLRYQNRRLDYLKSWWSVVNWENAMHKLEQLEKPGELEHTDGSPKERA